MVLFPISMKHTYSCILLNSQNAWKLNLANMRKKSFALAIVLKKSHHALNVLKPMILKYALARVRRRSA